MDDRLRYRRLRLAVKRLSQERRKQAKKIDVLCNDLIAAQRQFIRRLSTISFAADFYEMIVGMNDLPRLLQITAKAIAEQVPNASVAFFLRRPESFDVHVFESKPPALIRQAGIERGFTPELVGHICQMNRVCTLDDMFALGLEDDAIRLNEITAATVPLGLLGSSMGFILIWRPSQDRLTPELLHNISAVGPGLSQAIQSCRALAHWPQ